MSSSPPPQDPAAPAPAPLPPPLPRNVEDPAFALEPWLLAYPNRDAEFDDDAMEELVLRPREYARSVAHCHPVPLMLSLEPGAEAGPRPPFNTKVTDPQLLRGLAEMGYHTMTPTQNQVFDPIFGGCNLLVFGQASAGKTLATLLPALSWVMRVPTPHKCPRIVYLAPTRELAIDTKKMLDRLLKYTNLHVALLIGDLGSKTITKRIVRGIDVAVCTPGTLRDITIGYKGEFQRAKLDLRYCRYFIADEADLLLSDIFRGVELHRIFDELKKNCSFLFVAPFMPKEMLDWLNRYFTEGRGHAYPSFFYSPAETRVIDRVTNYVVLLANGESKTDCIPQIREVLGYAPAVVISNNADRATSLAEEFPVDEALVLDYRTPQSTRNRIRRMFESSKADILSGTDLLTTGINLQRRAAYILADFRKSRKQFFIRRLTRAALNPMRTAVHILQASDAGSFFSFCERWNIVFSYLFPPTPGAIEQAVRCIERHRRAAENRAEAWYNRAREELGRGPGAPRGPGGRGAGGGAGPRAAGGLVGRAEDVEGGGVAEYSSSDRSDGADDRDFEPTDEEHAEVGEGEREGQRTNVESDDGGM